MLLDWQKIYRNEKTETPPHTLTFYQRRDGGSNNTDVIQSNNTDVTQSNNTPIASFTVLSTATDTAFLKNTSAQQKQKECTLIDHATRRIYCAVENRSEEDVRRAAGAAVREMRKWGVCAVDVDCSWFDCVGVGVSDDDGVSVSGGVSGVSGVDDMTNTSNTANTASSHSSHNTTRASLKAAALDGVLLASFTYDFLKRSPTAPITLANADSPRARAQNMARFMALTPANLMTPAVFAEYARDMVRGLGLEGVVGVEVKGRREIGELGMELFLSVGKGSVEEPLLLVVTYLGRGGGSRGVGSDGRGDVSGDGVGSGGVGVSGGKDGSGVKRAKASGVNATGSVNANDPANASVNNTANANDPVNANTVNNTANNTVNANHASLRDGHSYDIVMVGKGITFDSGGISLKPTKGMEDMKGDMMGGAVVLCALFAAAQARRPINAKVLVPLCENLPAGSATKPGDVVAGRSGTRVEINNTDAEGRLVLADALHAAAELAPRVLLTASTLTGACVTALGAEYYAVYTESDALFARVERAGRAAADRGWRMPLDRKYRRCMESGVADLRNCGYKAGSCTAAIFLREFVGMREFVHLDIAGMMGSDETVLYGESMSGRPCAMLVELLNGLSD